MNMMSKDVGDITRRSVIRDKRKPGRQSGVRFVHAVTAGGSVKFLPVV